MPSRAAAAGVIRHQLHYVWNGEMCVTVLHVAHGATPTQAMVDADRGVLTYWHTNTWRAIARSECQLRVIKSWSMQTAPPTKFADLDLYPLTPITGTMTAACMGWAITAAISLRTGTIGELPKPISGRIYHVGGIRTDIVDQYQFAPSQAQADAFAGNYEVLRAAFTGVGNIGTLAVVSYYNGGTRTSKVSRVTPLVLPVTHVKTDRRLDVQRRRMPRQQSYVTN